MARDPGVRKSTEGKYPTKWCTTVPVGIGYSGNERAGAGLSGAGWKTGFVTIPTPLSPDGTHPLSIHSAWNARRCEESKLAMNLVWTARQEEITVKATRKGDGSALGPLWMVRSDGARIASTGFLLCQVVDPGSLQLRGRVGLYAEENAVRQRILIDLNVFDISDAWRKLTSSAARNDTIPRPTVVCRPSTASEVTEALFPDICATCIPPFKEALNAFAMRSTASKGCLQPPCNVAQSQLQQPSGGQRYSPRAKDVGMFLNATRQVHPTLFPQAMELSNDAILEFELVYCNVKSPTVFSIQRRRSPSTHHVTKLQRVTELMLPRMAFGLSIKFSDVAENETKRQPTKGGNDAATPLRAYIMIKASVTKRSLAIKGWLLCNKPDWTSRGLGSEAQSVNGGCEFIITIEIELSVRLLAPITRELECNGGLFFRRSDRLRVMVYTGQIVPD
ncbi:hypothetical protein C8R44DRAFT_949453 [Mycena epipterygia]|nr:hypothetical protein C8R44DRAFT_949453 [Mycena epipterygia]